MYKKIFFVLLILPIWGLSQYSVSNWNFIGATTGTDGNQSYGWSCSNNKDGSIIAGGQTGYDNSKGLVKVYKYSGNNNWQQLGQDIVGQNYNDRAGYSVDLNSAGDIIAITYPKITVNSGYIKVFKYDGTAWQQLGQTITSVNGFDVSISSTGYRMAFTRTNDTAAIYDFNGTSWVQVGQNVEGTGSGGYMTRNLCLSGDGNSVAISVAGTPPVYPVGHLTVFSYNGTNWAAKGQIFNNNDIEAQLYFGNVSLSEDGSRMVFSANSNLNNIPYGYMHMYQFNSTSNMWDVLGQPVKAATADLNHVSLSADGNRFLTANYYYDYNNLSRVGKAAVYDYKQDTGNWLQVGADIYGYPDSYVFFGSSACLSGDGKHLTIGATPEGGYGNLYNFQYTAEAPKSVTISTLAGQDQYIYIDETVQLQASVLPTGNNIDNSFSWSVSSGSQYVTVDQNGLVKGLSPGVALIKAISNADS
ncbi:MAG: hypothetical protein DI529_16130, partial [Chryseobacterium sp.]